MTIQRPPLEEMTLRQLRRVASELNISRYSRMRKDQLLNAIQEIQRLQAAPDYTRVLEGQEEVEAAKFDVGQTERTSMVFTGVDETLPDLPGGYGESCIVLMPRDPQWAYAYWDVSNASKELMRRQGGVRLALRFYDITDINIETQRPHSLQQYECDELAREWYLPVPVSDRDYMIEIGYVALDGSWLMLARSSSVRIPPVYPSDWIDDQFITIDWDEDLRSKTFLRLVNPARQLATASVSAPVSQEAFALAESAASKRSTGSVFGSMHQVPEESLSSYVFPSGMGQWASGAGQTFSETSEIMSGVGMVSGISTISMSGVGMVSGVGATGMSGVGMTSGISTVGMSGVGMVSGVSATGMSGVGMTSGISTVGMSGVGMVSGVGTMSGVGMSGIGAVGMSGVGMMSGAGLSSAGMSGVGMSGIGAVGMSGVGMMSGAGLSSAGMSGVGMSGIGAVGMSGIGMMSGVGLSSAGMSGVGMSGIGAVGMSGIGMMSGVGLSSAGMSGVGMMSGVGFAGAGMSGVGMMSGTGLYTTSGAGMSGIGFSASMPPIRPRQFWMVADAELIIYGATEVDATVTIAGQPVKLNPDGTFRMQISFQDGDFDFPIMAVAADGEQTRSIHLKFSRETIERRTNPPEESVQEWWS